MLIKLIISILMVFFACASAQSQYYLQKAYEFNYVGNIDSEDWICEDGSPRNQEKQYYTDRLENVRVDGEYLIIEAHKESYEGYAYTSGSILTRGKYTFKYGKVEIRAKMTDGDGTWPAAWTTGDNYDQVGWPACGEIDIFEHVGREPGVIHANVHYGLTDHYAAPGLITGIDVTQFHTYVIEWDREAIKWSVDGVQYHSFQLSEAQEGDYNPFMNDHILRLNLAIGGTFGGDIDYSKFPHQLVVDSVRIFSWVDDKVFDAMQVVKNYLLFRDKQ